MWGFGGGGVGHTHDFLRHRPEFSQLSQMQGERAGGPRRSQVSGGRRGLGGGEEGELWYCGGGWGGGRRLKGL